MHWIYNFENGKSPCRVNHAATAVGANIYLFGGYCQQKGIVELKFYSPIDVHVLNTAILKWSKRSKPMHPFDQQYLLTPFFRYGHTCVTYDGLIYLWGGRADWNFSLCNILFVYNPKKHLWSHAETDGNRPDGRDGHSACVISNSMYIFGGYVQRVKKFTNDLFEFNFKTSLWTLVQAKNTKPHCRDFHTASAVGNRMYVFGGRMDRGGEVFTGESFYSNDLYVFDTLSKTWTELKPDTSSSLEEYTNNDDENSCSSLKYTPCGRRSHSAVVYKKKIILFGGFQENIKIHYNDLFELDTDKCEWRKLCALGLYPNPRRRHSCIVIDDRMYLFGGTGSVFKSSLPPPSFELDIHHGNFPLVVTENPVERQLAIVNANEHEPSFNRVNHRMDLNPTNDQSLRRRPNFNVFNNLNQVFNAALAALNNRPRLEHYPTLDSSSGDNTTRSLDEINGAHNEIRLSNHRLLEPVRVLPLRDLLYQEQNGEMDENVEIAENGVNNEEPQRMEINEIIHHENGENELEENGAAYNYIVEEEEEVNEFDDLQNENGNFNFDEDSGEEDIIDDDDNDDDEISQVPSLKVLCMNQVINSGLSTDSLPKSLAEEMKYFE